MTTKVQSLNFKHHIHCRWEKNTKRIDCRFFDFLTTSDKFEMVFLRAPLKNHFFPMMNVIWLPFHQRKFNKNATVSFDRFQGIKRKWCAFFFSCQPIVAMLFNMEIFLYRISIELKIKIERISCTHKQKARKVNIFW